MPRAVPLIRRARRRLAALLDPPRTSPARVAPRLAVGPPADPLALATTVQDAAAAAGIPAFAIPLLWSEPVRLGIPAGRAGDLLALLSGIDPHLYVTARAHPGPWRTALTAPIADAVTLLDLDPAALYLHHAPDPAPCRADVLDSAGAVEIELWTTTAAGTLASRYPNLHAGEIDLSRAVPAQIAIRTTTLASLSDFAAVTPEQIPFPIDAVYLWVDGDDPAWRARQAAALAACGRPPAPEAVSDSRFRQHDELRYSLRSLERHAPWIRHIYLVTDRQTPAWLDVEHPRVTVVDHTDLLPASALPTFNSHALSAHLHRIPGLAEHFLYLNDDVFLGRPVDPTLWFSATGAARVHHTLTTSPGLSVASPTVPVAARRTAAHALADHGAPGGIQHRNLQHGPHPVITAVMAECWDRFGPALATTTSHPFRDAGDIEPVWLHNAVGRDLGQVHDGPTTTYRYVLMDDPDVEDVLADLLARRDRDVFCLNDAHGPDQSGTGSRSERYRRFLEAYLPHPSAFER